MTLPKGFGTDGYGRAPTPPLTPDTENPRSIKYNKYVFVDKSNCGMGKNYRITFKGRQMSEALMAAGIGYFFTLLVLSIGFTFNNPALRPTDPWYIQNLSLLITTVIATIMGLITTLIMGGALKQFKQNATRSGECGRASDAAWCEVLFYKAVGKYDSEPRSYAENTSLYRAGRSYQT